MQFQWIEVNILSPIAPIASRTTLFHLPCEYRSWPPSLSLTLTTAPPNLPPVRPAPCPTYPSSASEDLAAKVTNIQTQCHHLLLMLAGASFHHSLLLLQALSLHAVLQLFPLLFKKDLPSSWRAPSYFRSHCPLTGHSLNHTFKRSHLNFQKSELFSTLL